MQLTTSYHEEGKKEGLIEGILDLLGDKEDFSMFGDKLIKELEKQTELETLKTSLRKAAKATSVKHFLEGSNGDGF